MAKKRSRKKTCNDAPCFIEPDLKKAQDLVMRLMAIPGKSGDEGEVAEFITHQLRQAGAPASSIRTDSAHRRTPIKSPHGNLMLKLLGTFRAPRRLLMAHMDTVPICVGSKPVLKGRLVSSADPQTGLGADDRAGVAVVLVAALEILRRKLPHPPLVFLWTIQEEIGLFGARLITQSMLSKPGLAFNFDGGAPEKITIGATGGYRMVIEISGIASHAGGAPEQGVSAISIACLAIADLTRNGWHGDIHKNGKHGTSNVGFIHGGEATNVVTDRVTIKAEARSHDPVFRKRIVREIEKAFKMAAKELKNVFGDRGQVLFNGELDYDSFRLKKNEPSIKVAEAAISAVGRQPIQAITNGGVDANWMVVHGIPTVTLGCGQRNPHMVSERLDLDDFNDACRIGLRMATAGEAN